MSVRRNVKGTSLQVSSLSLNNDHVLIRTFNQLRIAVIMFTVGLQRSSFTVHCGIKVDGYYTMYI